MTGLTGVTQGHGLDIKPYVLGTAQDAPVRNEAIVYIVYTHNWLDDPLLAQFATQDRRLSTKAVYTYRF